MRKYHVEIVASVRGIAVHVGGYVEADNLLLAHKVVGAMIPSDGTKLVSIKITDPNPDLRKLVPMNDTAQPSTYLYGPWVK